MSYTKKMSYFSLPRGKLHKKEDIKKLNNLRSNYSRLFYKDRANDVDVDIDDRYNDVDDRYTVRY